jgi:NAD(P)H-dependent flavin oxidoreductase YrpB (nitropropane dioxygenase family)
VAIEVPIFNVGFGAASTAGLAAAVSKDGGCGVIGCGSLPVEAVRSEIRRVRELTGAACVEAAAPVPVLAAGGIADGATVASAIVVQGVRHSRSSTGVHAIGGWTVAA